MNPTKTIRILAWLLLGVLGFGTLVLAAPGSALTGETGVDRFGGCLAAQRSGQLLLMIDESASLRDTDPTANRVKAAKYLAQRLADYAQRTGVTIDVSIAGFSSTYQQDLGWTKLDAGSLPQIESSLESFRDRNNGNDTDYWSALEGARAEFANAPKPAEGRRCQALAWFTDGKLDFNRGGAKRPFAPDVSLDSQEGVDATIAAAREGICRDRGIADQIRSSGIVMFAIGLAPKPEQVPDFDLMKAIATGQPTGSVSSCGAITSPTPGDFYLAQNIEDLLFAFDKFGTPDQTPIEIDTGACPKVICEEAKHRFVLDRSVSNVSVLAAADRTGLVPYLLAPDGSSLDLSGDSKSGELSGVRVDSKAQSDKSVSFRMSGSQAPTWQGVWALVFVDPTGDATAKTRSSIHITGDLVPAWPDATKVTLRTQETATLTFGVVDDQQKPVDAATLLGQASLSAVLVDSAGTEHRIANALPKDQISAPQTVDLSDASLGAGILHLTLDVTTADAHEPSGAVVPGTKLSPQRVDLSVNIAPPVGYPTVEGPIDFGRLEGAGTLSSSLAVKGPGCVWLPADSKNAIAGAPDGVGDIRISSSANSPDNCVKLAAGEQESLPIEMQVPNAATGSANGAIEIMLGPDTGDKQPVAVKVDYTASLEKPLNPSNFILTLITALILGPGLPIALLYLSKWWVSRIPARGLRSQQIPVRISGNSVQRDHGPLVLLEGELTNLVPGLDKPARRLDLGSGVELHAKMGLAPFGAGYVVAKAQGRAGAAGRSGATVGKTPDAKLPLAVHNTWFVLHDPTGPAEFATVVLLASVEADDQKVQSLIAEIASALPKVVADLRARAAPQLDGQPPAGNQPPNPFDGQPHSPGPNPFGGPGVPASPGDNPFGGSVPSGPSPYPPSGPGQPGGNPFGATGSSPSSPNMPSNPGSNPFA
jgi:hypothetical protein